MLFPPKKDWRENRLFVTHGISHRLPLSYTAITQLKHRLALISDDPLSRRDRLSYYEDPAAPFSSLSIRTAEELGREPTVDEVFLRTHICKKDSTWVDLRSQNTYGSFQSNLNQASEGADESGSQMVDSATRLKLWAKSVGGKNRGRLYGVGDRSSNYRPGVSSLAPDTVPSMGCSQVSSHYSHEMATQLATLEERAKAAEDEVRNTREELRQAELKRQKEAQQSEQRAAEFQMQLIALTKSVAAMQAEPSRR
ncbi:unnamed protein product [Trifolium pratense]|uniref:Uncharacterized protein n=1 Tax=Trifolium pratense TaxID=57577 RepID=A0ACB0K5V9_TRIPR|nr:unnamed protein product [Trifolium pratense]